MDMRSFGSYLEEKYGVGNADEAHHYEKAQTSGDTTKMLIVASDVSGAAKVTNREYEETEQDKKRQIRLLNPAYIETLADEFKSMMKESIL